MMTQDDRLRLLEESLVRALPEASQWARGREPVGPAKTREGRAYWAEHWIEVASPVRPDAQRLRILLRHDGDVQVEYHVANKDGSPFEAFFVLGSGSEKEAIEEIARLVAELIDEQLVLAYASGFFRGGRRFLAPSSLTERTRRRLEWITSWRGTYDWQL